MKALTALAITSLLCAQTPAPPSPAAEAPGRADISTTVRVVMAPVTVTDRDGSIINGLTQSDFRLYDNKKLQRITEDLTTHPLSLVVAVQANAAVEKILPQVQKIGAQLQAQVIGDDGEVAVMEFDHRRQWLTDFTSDPEKITTAFKKLKPGSWTSTLNDATIEAIGKLKNRPLTRRRVLLLIAESRDQGSELRPREVLSAADFANVEIHSIDMSHLVAAITGTPPPTPVDNRPPGAVHLPGGQVMTPTVQSQQDMGNWVPLIKDIFDEAKGLFIKNPLDIYTTYTGGRQYSFMSQKALDQAVSQLGQELHSQYLLTYSPNNQEEAGFHNIMVVVNKPDLKVRTRDGYYLAGLPPAK